MISLKILHLAQESLTSQECKKLVPVVIMLVENDVYNSFTVNEPLKPCRLWVRRVLSGLALSDLWAALRDLQLYI